MFHRPSIALATCLACAGGLRAEPASESDPPPPALKIVAVVGTGGTGEYRKTFAETAKGWRDAAAKAEGVAFERIGPGEETAPDSSPLALAPESESGQRPAGESESPNDPDGDGDPDPESGEATDAGRLRRAIRETEAPQLWIVLIGHGTFDGREAKFAVRGSDFSDGELADWLTDYEGELALINCASASGSFIEEISGPDRIVITATKSASEVFFTRFGRFFAEAVGGRPEADLDNDEQVSLLESFLHASERVKQFYESEGRLATEHALLDDNGDGLGSRAEWYEGTTPGKTPAEDAEPDGALAAQQVLVKSPFERRLSPEQRRRRDELERKVKRLRRERDSVDEATYYRRLEKWLLELARIYRSVSDS